MFKNLERLMSFVTREDPRVGGGGGGGGSAWTPSSSPRTEGHQPPGRPRCQSHLQWDVVETGHRDKVGGV